MESKSENCDNPLRSLWGTCDKWTLSEFPPIESSSEHIVQYENQTGDVSKMKNCFGNPENSHHIKRWELMKKVLNEAKIKNVSDLEVTIKKYNSYNFTFETLNKFFEQVKKIIFLYNLIFINESLITKRGPSHILVILSFIVLNTN